MGKCIFDRAWIGACSKESAENDFCEEHINSKCCVCKKQATRECAYAGQFVCGSPLCDNCTGFNDPSKDSGSWGFMNHSHKKK